MTRISCRFIQTAQKAAKFREHAHGSLKKEEEEDAWHALLHTKKDLCSSNFRFPGSFNFSDFSSSPNPSSNLRLHYVMWEVKTDLCVALTRLVRLTRRFQQSGNRSTDPTFLPVEDAQFER